MTIKAGGEQTDNGFSLGEHLAPIGFGPPPHVHHAEDEVFYVLAGAVSGFSGERTFRGGPGTYVYLPRGVPHTWRVEGDVPARLLVLTKPADFEHFVAESGKPAPARVLPPTPPGPAEFARMLTVAPKYGIEILAEAPPAAREPVVAVEVYDDFGARGREYGTSEYLSKWSLWDLSPLEPEAIRTRSFANGRLDLNAAPLTVSADNIFDHIKYLAMSTKRFPIPANGSIPISADVRASTPDARAGHVLPTTGRALLEGQQAAATLHMLNIDETGQLYDWFVSEHKAFALYERLFSPEVGLDKGYTQIVAEFDIAPGVHTYALRYSRTPDGPDSIEYLIDGQVMASADNSGIPLDRQDPARYGDITYRSHGPGEPVRDRMKIRASWRGLDQILARPWQRRNVVAGLFTRGADVG